jgi:hypothetical protein
MTTRGKRYLLFCLAVFVWVLTTIPCAHLFQLYTRHHMIGIGSHPERFAAYSWLIVSTSLGLGFLGTLLLWSLSRVFKSEPRDALLWGILIGPLLAVGLRAIVNPSFRVLSSDSLGLGNFLYSGFLAGAVTGEIRLRSLRGETSVPRTELELKQDFYITALAVWAVILKVFECLELVTVQPGRDVFGVHLFMFLSILLWTPLVCRYLWKWTPSRASYAMLWACAAGVLLPPVIGYILHFPATILLYMGVPLAYEMCWGMRFLYYAAPLRPVLFLGPGVTWGIIVGLLRWRYLTVESRTSL